MTTRASSSTSAARQGPLGPLANFLERFRRAGGVPAEIGGDVAGELAPLFAALDQIDEKAAARRSQGEAARARIEYETAEEIERIMAEGRARAAAERDDALKAVLRGADAEAAAIVRQGEREAAAIRETGRERVEDVVAAVVERILEEAR